MELCEVRQIEGKGLGTFATKFIKRGSLIFKEEAQMPNVDQPPPNLQMQADSWIDYFKAVMKLFDQMDESDKKEYLNLHNKYESDIVESNFRLKLKLQMLKTLTMMMEVDQDKADEILQIVGIYETNGFEDGLKIKTSRLNHSCFPNAVTMIERNELRATYDIKEGEEITINYRAGKRVFSMRKKETRQKHLLQAMDFDCSCHFCEKQDNLTGENDFLAIETEIEELIEKVEKLQIDCAAAKEAHLPNMGILLFPPEKCRMAIGFYKQLYNLGKKMKAHRACLYEILNLGYQVASLEYQICWANDEHQFLQEFKRECVNFSKAAEAFGKLLGTELVMPELWRKRHQDFEKYFMENIEKMQNLGQRI